MRLRLANRNRMTLLEDFVYRNKGFESLHFVCKDRLSALVSLLPQQSSASGVYGGYKRTLSYPPRRRPKIYGPMYTQCSFAHVFLFNPQPTIKQVSEHEDRTGAEVDSTHGGGGVGWVNVLFGAVSSTENVLAQLLIFACS
jgi:hypothetical protein